MEHGLKIGGIGLKQEVHLLKNPRVYGKDQIRNRVAVPVTAPGYPLILFRGKYTTNRTIQDITSDEQSLEVTRRINERDALWSKLGIRKL